MQKEPSPDPIAGLTPAQPVGITDLVSFQRGAVVSRTLVRKQSGTVTLFAFDEGQGLSEHTAPFDALVQILEGEAEIVISGQPHRVGAGQVILLPAGKPHALLAITPYKMLLTMIRQST